VKFCPKCGTRLKLKQVKAEKGGATITLLCENCGYSDKAGRTVTQANEEEYSDVPTIKVVGEKESKLSTLPTTKIECP
jgi:DNA-directed RNA polymerase subunit M/transcription elongation factor TFIIS